ncbi:penicillin-binding transpeptidase domain-containing protein [Pelagicoccus sp. SDUM812003]|uniref:penicillin-binding transpeptidase domain-containing protein n=1 Tax=Pelagicoccus sp. SDUM812003 TaxID=3041267 RepID=UPI00280EF72B|nr:penicillin-binding transpeptidase domain-containing protein [Pelagicoccus sp. SDUM812003]MDQ8203299.1 penicillin-binding transpeptidase domain-containing protein [Pelagicoccus sp. SDUM812003]
MNSEEKMKYQGRLLLFYGLLALMISTLLAGVGYRQLIETAEYSEQVKVQNHRRIITPAPRGNIYDREGKLLVGNKPKFSAVVYLSDAGVRSAFRREYRTLVRDYRERKEKFKTDFLQKKARANVIQTYLDDVNRMLAREEEVNVEKVSAHLNYNPLLPFPIISDLTREEFAILLESLPIESPVQVYVSNQRHYPYESTASHTLGYVSSTVLTADEGMPGEELTTFSEKGTFGRSGVELQYDETLQGEMGLEIWVVDPLGFQVESIQKTYPTKGSDIQLSLDIDIQRAAEEAFKYPDRASGTWKENVGAAVMLDVHTLEVLAMVSKPDYDLNDTMPFISTEIYEKMKENSGLQNRALQGLYPPGSPFKLVTSIAALKANTITGETEHFCPGYYQFPTGAKQYCWKRTGHQEHILWEAIRDSCNVYFYLTGLETGVDIISREAIYMGLGDPTGIDLPHETQSMIIPTKEWKKRRFNQSWYPGDATNLAIGQGYTRVTPLQMAVFVSSIARREVVTRPSILKLTPQEANNRPPPKPLGLTDEQYRIILDGMIGSAEQGSSQRIQVEGLSTAAKTGTAEVAKEGGKIELAWIVGFAPVENPQVALAVIIEGQDLNRDFFGGVHAAPIARAMLKAYVDKNPHLLTPEPAASEVGAQP